MAPSFAAVNQRIEEEKRAKFCGTASLRLSALEYRNPRRDGAGGSTRNIDAIERMFRQENGCRKEDSRHHAKAVISPQMLEAALRNAGISGEKLMSDALPFYELEFDPGIQIECIEGHDRLAAADNVLYGSKTRWIVDLYLNDISDDLRLLLSDGFDYQKPPDDGTYYVTIRSFQGHHGEKNRFFENLWLGRLATNANKRDLFDQLSTDKILCSSFDELLEIPALFGGFWLGSIHHLIRMKCPELHRSYLNHTFKWWHDICGGEQAAMRLITREDVEALEGKAPGACAADARSLFSQVMGGEVFGNFARSRREEIWSLVCSSSQRCLIPSLTTFFNDRKLLHDAIDSIRKILDFRYKPTLNSSLQEAFKDADQRQDRCIIQLSETTFGSVAGDAELRKHLAIRQIWLAAIRNYTELPAEPQKSSTMALSRNHAYDRERLFLPQIHEGLNSNMGEMSSTFVRWSMYCAYFGTPPALGAVDIETRANLSVPASQANEKAQTKMTFEGEHQSKLKELARDEESRREQLDELGLEIRRREAELAELQRETKIAQTRLDSLHEADDLSHNSMPDIRDSVMDLIPNHPVSRSPSPSKRQSSEVPASQNRNTHLELQNLESDNPPTEHRRTQNATESDKPFQIKFLELKKTMTMKPSQKGHGVMQQAILYMKAGYSLADRNGARLNPRDCYDKVVDDRTYTIILQKDR
ncbi:hypothetical protein BM221_007214 [Beauveria bassiana]|uniref:Uncharacterized protein n=1 Tax=Beauveria bassiana TaxID=176275 RepID=A0A2N6NJX8_BEABA|nr:hypothetical protein BM221_007214 [Beauveria bassiana]